MPELQGFHATSLSYVLVVPGSTLLTDRAVSTLRGPAVNAGQLGARCELLRGETGWAVSDCSRTLDGARLQSIDVDSARIAVDLVKADARFSSMNVVLVSKVDGDPDVDVMVIVSNSDSPFVIDEVIVYLKDDKIVRTKIVKGVV